jgi:hypothetical protein
MFVEGHPYWSTHFQHANNMTAVAATDEKSIPALKFNIFMGHDRIDSILGSY